MTTTTRVEIHDDEALDLDNSDILTLAPGVRLDVAEAGALVVDDWLRSSTRCNRTGAEIIGVLAEAPATVTKIADRIATRYGVVPEAVVQDVRDLMTSLDANAQINAHRPLRLHLSPLAMARDFSAILHFRTLRRTARRFPTTLRGVFRAVARQGAVGIGIIAMFGLALAILVRTQSGGQISWDRALSGGAVPLLLAVLHAFLLGVHEFGHVLMLRHYDPGSGIVAVRGLRIGVVHRPLERRPARLLALAGPLLAVACSIPLGLFGRSLDLLPWSALQFAPALGVAHLASLLPWAADGRQFWNFERAARTRAGTEEVA